jgi:glycosyltransferase involved in cell wall biosynthesis
MRVAFSWDPSLFNYRNMLGNPYGGLLVEALQRHGYSFELISLYPTGDTPSVNLRWVWRNRHRVQGIHLHWLLGVTNTATATRAWVRMGFFAASLLLARLLGYRVIWTLHNMLPHERPHWGVDVVGRYVMALLANSIICHCEYAARAYTRRFIRRRNLYVIPHGDFRRAYPADVSREEARRELGIPQDAFVYTSFGNIRGYKGHDDMLEAFQGLQGDHLRLVVAGQRHQFYDGLVGNEPMGDPRVLMHEGKVPIDKLQIYFHACDVAVFPYRDALTSGAIITALGFGCPIIATRVGCIPELLDDTGAGVLVPPGDVEAIGAAMRDAQDWNLAERTQAAHNVADELGWDRIARQTMEAYGTPRSS